LDIYVG